MRLHYGHPDIFDKLWFTTRGGVSKASRGINLSEDIFAGYTAVIRGGGVTMQRVRRSARAATWACNRSKFEAKLSQGNAEQCLARDVSRVAARLGLPAAAVVLLRGYRALHQLGVDRGYDPSRYLPIFTVSCVWC